MRIALFSDIHGNLEALLAVLEDINQRNCGLRYCLGDCVGYGANPSECIATLKAQNIFTLKGNHDEATALNIPLTCFNPVAARALYWTRENLNAEDRSWLDDLQYQLELPAYGMTLCHASAVRPEEYDYIFYTSDAYPTLKAQRTPLVFVGHTHCPAVFSMVNDAVKEIDIPNGPIYLDPGTKYVVNVGSIGQPRDGDPQSCYVIYDSEAQNITFHRVNYPIAQAQEKILSAKLPERLAIRLALGR